MTGGRIVLRRLSVLWVLVVCAAGLALPASALAANPYRAHVLINHCSSTGGAHGRGYIEVEVKAREIGVSGTNYFVVKSRQEWSSGLGWSTRSTWPKEMSLTFPNDATNYYHLTDRRYDFTKNDEISNRIVITVQYWSKSSGLLATRTVKGTPC